MAGMACCCPSALSSRSTSWLVVGTYQGRTPTGKRFQRRSLVIKAEVNFVNSEEAKKLIAVEGYAVVDVRDRTQFERAHIKGCYHVPLFIENTDNDLGTIIKRTVHNNFSGLFFGLPFTKPNPELCNLLRASFHLEASCYLFARRDSGISCRFLMLYLTESSYIVRSLQVIGSFLIRSAAAANKLEEAGYQNIACITSGLQSVTSGTFDTVGSTELQNAGKAGLVTIQGKISAVLGTVLICAYLFITFFPDQAEKLLELVPSG
ncbi:UNVERIFIED_CONTAM: Rhodanese-like domain-containing protein 9, chloroplastic [Sesamum radiatum]|uniref:Rhodanese-like domain-containing protein 9, chloroplastic n=1 Tax=Sesamum radiatum TaxID=300843 RepID=A0AAW2TKZ1_SESRA